MSDFALIEFRPDARCVVAGCKERPALVRHARPGEYAPSDPHVCDQHFDVLTEADVPLWTRGWKAGYAAGMEAMRREVAQLADEWEADDEESLYTFGQHLMGGAVLSCAERLRAALRPAAGTEGAGDE